MILIPLFIFLVLLLGAGYYFARVIIFPRVLTFDETRSKIIEWGWLDEDDYSSWNREEVSIPSPFGYPLAGVYHPLDGAARTVIVSHGITLSRLGSVKYAALFRKRGYNVLLYDLRHHGKSSGPNTSFGFYEKHDLKAAVDFAFSRLPAGGQVGTLGESLGAAITLQHAAIDPRIAFAVADCSYSNLAALFRLRSREDYHLPPFPLLLLAEMFVRLLGGWTFAAASPIRTIGAVETPVFFIHGKEDGYIPPSMSIEMYQAKKCGYRRLYLAPGAGHAEALVKNPIEYDQQIEEFLKEIAILPGTMNQ